MLGRLEHLAGDGDECGGEMCNSDFAEDGDEIGSEMCNGSLRNGQDQSRY